MVEPVANQTSPFRGIPRSLALGLTPHASFEESQCVPRQPTSHNAPRDGLQLNFLPWG